MSDYMERARKHEADSLKALNAYIDEIARLHTFEKSIDEAIAACKVQKPEDDA